MTRETAKSKVEGLMADLEAAIADATAEAKRMDEKWPIRQASAKGKPKPNTSIERCCVRCGASMLGLAPGKTGERGLWKEWRWYCSQECFDGKRAGGSNGTS